MKTAKFTFILVVLYIVTILACGLRKAHSQNPGPSISGSLAVPSSITWSLNTLPAGATTGAYQIWGGPDGYLYLEYANSTSPYTNHLAKCQASSGCTTWVDMTGTGLPTLSSIAQCAGCIGLLPNGNPIVTLLGPTAGTVGYSLPYECVIVSSACVWTVVTGWNGNASSFTSGYVNDSGGLTYFIGQNSDLYVNASPNSTSFSLLTPSLYHTVCGQTEGFVYEISLFTVSATQYLWILGEGGLARLSGTGFATCTMSLIGSSTPTGNGTGLGSTPDASGSLLALRPNAANFPITACTSNLCPVNTMTNLGSGTLTQTQRSTFQHQLNYNIANTTHLISGTTWLFSGQTSSARVTFLSRDSGATWTDLSTGVPTPNCAGTNLNANAWPVNGQVAIKCQNGGTNFLYISSVI